MVGTEPIAATARIEPLSAREIAAVAGGSFTPGGDDDAPPPDPGASRSPGLLLFERPRLPTLPTP